MHFNKTILHLNDPLCGENSATKGLVFHQNESFLSQAQTALWHARREAGWVCVSARGTAADIALALAAQLPVDRLVLQNMQWKMKGLPRQLNRLRAYARRNMALVTAEILLVDADEASIQGIHRGTGRCRICVLDDLHPDRFADAWDRLCENNLRFKGKCV